MDPEKNSKGKTVRYNIVKDWSDQMKYDNMVFQGIMHMSINHR